MEGVVVTNMGQYFGEGTCCDRLDWTNKSPSAAIQYPFSFTSPKNAALTI